MNTLHNALDEYKKAIQLKFEVEKTKEYSSFLLSPSRAKLRQLCLERMKNNTNLDDLRSFSLFLGFEFSLSNLNKLKSQKDKFRPIETFFKGETDLTDVEGINVAAILVDFTPRPFMKYSKAKEIQKETTEKYNDNGLEKVSSTNSEDLVSPTNFLTSKPEFTFQLAKNRLKNRIVIGSLLILSGFGVKQLLFKEKECMKWCEDHYERISCIDETQGIASYEIIKPYNEKEFQRKKLKVCDTTTFVKNGKPVVWYSKKNNVVEFFNMDGDNPVNDAELKKVSRIIIKKYAEQCK